MIRGQAAMRLARQITAPLPPFTDPACVQHPELPWDGSKPDDDPATRRAVNVCCVCRDLGTCASFALNHLDLGGIWGGLTADQRTMLRTSNRRSRQ